MRYLGVDIGRKRTGLAVSDPTGLVARPLEVVRGGSDPRSLAALLGPIAEREEAEALVVGLPRRMGGEEGPEAERARAAAAILESELQLPVTLWDERLTSVRAAEILVERGVPPAEHRGVIDKVAAAVILQDFLDARSGATA
jgi:putative Holliday junction resolvase